MLSCQNISRLMRCFMYNVDLMKTRALTRKTSDQGRVIRAITLMIRRMRKKSLENEDSDDEHESFFLNPLRSDHEWPTPTVSREKRAFSLFGGRK